MSDIRSYTVPGIRCGSCRAAIAAELADLAGIELVDVDLGSRRVTVRATADRDAAIRASIERAGYEVAR